MHHTLNRIIPAALMELRVRLKLEPFPLPAPTERSLFSITEDVLVEECFGTT